VILQKFSEVPLFFRAKYWLLLLLALNNLWLVMNNWFSVIIYVHHCIFSIPWTIPHMLILFSAFKLLGRKQTNYIYILVLNLLIWFIHSLVNLIGVNVVWLVDECIALNILFLLFIAILHVLILVWIHLFYLSNDFHLRFNIIIFVIQIYYNCKIAQYSNWQYFLLNA